MEKHRKHKRNIYQKRRFWFWIIVAILFLLILFLFFFLKRTKDENRLIRVAVCGCVKNEAVYTMREGSDLGMLVRLANGFKLNANSSKLNLDQVVLNDSVYHIPCGGNSSAHLRNEFITEINKTIKLWEYRQFLF
jgi:hypothetical protein